MNIPELCTAGVVIACAAATAYLLSKPGGMAAVTRSEAGAHTVVRVRANQDLTRVELECAGENRALLSRAGLGRNESVEFRIPAVRGRIRVSVRGGSGHRIIEV